MNHTRYIVIFLCAAVLAGCGAGATQEIGAASRKASAGVDIILDRTQAARAEMDRVTEACRHIREVSQIARVTASAAIAIDATAEAVKCLETASAAAELVSAAIEVVQVRLHDTQDRETVLEAWGRRSVVVVVIGGIVAILALTGAGRVIRPLFGVVGDWIHRHGDRHATLAAKIDAGMPPDQAVAAMRGGGGRRFDRRYRQAKATLNGGPVQAVEDMSATARKANEGPPDG